MKKIKENTTKIDYTQKNKLERLLIELKLEYSQFNLQDKEYFYIVNLESVLEQSHKIYVLLMLSEDSKELLVICPNIYKLKESDSTLSVLSALNSANLKLTNGTVTLDEDETVTYKNVERFDRIESITKTKLINIFNDIIASIIYTAQEIKNLRK